MALTLHTLLLLLLSIFRPISALKLSLTSSLEDKSEGGIWKREAEIPVTGKPEQGYFIDIHLGTPPQRLSVVVDTGSANFAIAGNADLGVTNYFNSAQSSTFEGTPSEDFTVDYVNGSWDGYFAKDVFKFCEDCVSAKVDVALMTKAKNIFVAPDLWQGILGLGYKAIMQPHPDDADMVLDSITDHGDTGYSYQVFSLELCGRQNQSTTQLTGQLELEAEASDEYTYTKVVRQQYYQIELTDFRVGGKQVVEDCSKLNSPRAIIDSGTTNIMLPTIPYYSAIAAIEEYATTNADFAQIEQKYKITNAQFKEFLEHERFLCGEDPNLSVFSLLPDLEIQIAGSLDKAFSINVPPQQYVRQTMDSINKQKTISEGTKCYMIGIEKNEKVGTILGAAFLEHLTVLHDREGNRVGFKNNTNCQVSDPPFVKRVSALVDRDDKGGCLTMVRSKLPTAALIVTLTLILTTIVIMTCWWSKENLKKYLATFCLRFRRTQNYTYMLNSEDEDDESSLQMELDVIRPDFTIEDA